jgi:mannose-6-phosphate isomerase-like protein (cupin superfamily)
MAVTNENGPLGVDMGIKLQIASKFDAPSVEGRRGFLEYRDLGVAAASGGRMNARTTAMSATPGVSTALTTGWHYHLCEMQIGVILKGWVDMQFEDGTERRVVAGDVIMIPGGLRHNETAISDDFEDIELTVPADIGTVACEPPESWAR